VSVAKVTFIKRVGKITSLLTMRWCGSMLYQVHGGMCAVTIFIKVTLATLKCKFPDDGRGPKHVGETLI